MECVGKTCCAAYGVLPPAGILLPDFLTLELAKGFEPPTP
jgi:hypothetical protein